VFEVAQKIQDEDFSKIHSPEKVRLRQLKLNFYRNYARLRLDLEDAHLVLSGANGVGKTNILEAISLLSPGRGLRRAAYRDMICLDGSHDTMMPVEGGQFHQAADQAEFVVYARLESSLYGEVEIGTGSARTPTGETGRRVRINGAAQPIDHLLEFCRIVWLTPSMDGLFTGATGERRRFLDRFVLAIEPRHGRLVRDYDKAMRARNKLLAAQSHDMSWLGALERQMAALGVAIAAARWQLVDQLGNLIRQEQVSAFPRAVMELDGFLESRLQQGQSALDVEESFCALLTQSRNDDRLSGRTMTGPHRSDLKIIHAQKAMPAALASTGEQKALLTGLVLAHARLTTLLSGFTPLLLLDEVTAHLDQRRVDALFELIDDMGVQAFLTGTEQSLFHQLKGRGQFATIMNDSAIFNHEMAGSDQDIF